jgi:KaiC/GvpD/RAD55 family RecA-like ATPase
MKLVTGIKGLDELIDCGIESGSRNILDGPPGSEKTAFATEFLWHGLQYGETVAYDVKRESCSHYFGWIPFTITACVIELLE